MSSEPFLYNYAVSAIPTAIYRQVTTIKLMSIYHCLSILIIYMTPLLTFDGGATIVHTPTRLAPCRYSTITPQGIYPWYK